MMLRSLQRPLFCLLLLASATPWYGPGTALTVGIHFSLLVGTTVILASQDPIIYDSDLADRVVELRSPI